MLFSVVCSLYLELVLIEMYQTYAQTTVMSSLRGQWAGKRRGFGEQHGQLLAVWAKKKYMKVNSQ